MLDAAFLKKTFGDGREYEAYVATGKPEQQEAWAKVYERAALSDEQVSLIAAFEREMRILVSSGVWCGDCVQQCPFLARIAEASNGKIQVRFVDRDEHADLAERIHINGGARVPVAIFMAEDFEAASIFGDRTLTRYRALAAKQLGAACPLPGAHVADDELHGTLQEWIDEAERVHLMLRTSTRLRQKHGD